MTVAYWQVVGGDLLEDGPMVAGLRRAAEGELRLAAAREDAEPVGRIRSTEVDLYWLDGVDDDGQPTRRLEPAQVLTLVGQAVPAAPDARLYRFEQDTRRRVWDRPTRRGGRRR